MKIEPLLCFPSETKEQSIERLKFELSSFNNFNINYNYVSPIHSKEFPEKALKARLSILKNVYKNDYHTDSFDINRIIKRIQDGDELIWFWGSRSEVKNLFSYFHSNKDTLFPNLTLGTVTAINAKEEFGKGTAELCRSGSTDSTITGKPPIIYRTLEYLLNHETDLHNKYHTLCLVPRTRKSETGIRGGEAVKTIHTKYLRSRFWGYAPWYVMQGGVLEVLEYREINRNVQDVIKAIKSDELWYITDIEEAKFVKNLCLINFNISPKILNDTFELESRNVMGSLLSVKDENIKEFNHETIICGSEEAIKSSKQYSFKEALSKLIKNVCSCKVIRLNLMNKTHTAIQREIRKLGFRLTMISPPKNSWHIDDRGQRCEVNVPAYGFWCLPNKYLTIEPPYYINFDVVDRLESNILNYLRKIF